MVVALRPETGQTGVAGHTDIFQSLGEEHQKNVVRWALANRARVSEEARVALNNALIGNVSVRGFRESNVPDAPAIMLIQPVRNAALVVDAIAQSVLTVWCESRMELRGIVETTVNDAGGSDGSTLDDPGENLSGVLALAHPQYSSDDVRLMITLMSSERSMHDDGETLQDEQPQQVEETQQEKTQEPEEEPTDSTTDAQRIFDEFFAELRSLPASYPEWDGPLSRLMEEIAELKANKTREMEEANGPGSRIVEVVDAHAEVLSFFEWNVDERLLNATGPWDDAESVSTAIENLAELLERYETVRERGETYGEETRRATERAELQEKIVEALTALEEAAVMPTPKPVIEEIVPVEDTSAEDDSEPEMAETAEIADVTNDVERQYLRELVEALQRENADLKAAQDAAHRQITELNTAAEAAQNGYQALEQEHTDLHDEAEEAAPKYAEVQEQETLAAPPDFGDVASVLDFVENRWPNELRLALNNNSDHKLYFDQPNQVYSALEWLATTYRNSKTGEKPVGNLDVSLFTTCGWRYRPFQSDAAPGKYRSDYQTTDAEKNYSLDEHIGRGTGRTPGQIRVAFAWDEERKMVVVGYVGRHQRPNAT